MFATPVVETRLGGKEGGAATLTSFGRELVTLYRDIEMSAGKKFAARVAKLEKNLAALVAADKR